MKKLIFALMIISISSCSSMSSLKDIDKIEANDTEILDKNLVDVYNDISRATKFCFANNSATNYNIISNINDVSGEVMIVTGAELVSPNIWLVARLKKNGNKTEIKYTAGNSIWKENIVKMKQWAKGGTDC